MRSQAGNQSEVETLRQQLQTLKADSYGNEARLRSEIESLKNIISNLENKLGQCMNTSSISNLKNKLGSYTSVIVHYYNIF